MAANMLQGFVFLTFISVSLSRNLLREHGCSPFADVIFILDGSESIRRSDFNITQHYVRREVEALNVFDDGANVAVIVYSDDVSDVIPFNSNTNVDQLENDIMKLKQPRLGTNTASALREAAKLYKAHGRPDATKIVVLITDGDTRNKSPPRLEAKALKDNNISIVAVGVGPETDDTELKALASKPEFVKKVENFPALDMLRIPYHEICIMTTTTPRNDQGCQLNGNIVFIFDGSESISVAEERIMKDFVKDQIDHFSLGDGRAGMGLVMFSNDATIDIRLSNTISSASLKNSVDNLRLPSKGSNIARGIEVMEEMFRLYGRPNENRIAVLITDGVSIDNDETVAVARQARNQNIKLVSIGIGSEGQIDTDELKKIASSEDLVFTPKTFDDFAMINYAEKLSAVFDCGTTTPRTPSTTTRWTTTTRTPITWTTTTRTTTPRTTTTRIPITWTTTRRTTTTPRYITTIPWTTRTRIPITWTTTTPRTRSTTTPWTTTTRTPSTWSTRTTTSTRIGPVDPIAPGCEDCRIKFGAGFARHPDSCEKFIRCSIQTLGNGKFRAFAPVVFDCPRGLFWDQEDTLTCRYPNQVKCPGDRCRTETGLKAYGDPTDCGVYWLCGNGYTLGKRCCAENFAFDDARGECVRDNNCLSAFCRVGNPGGDCLFLADSTDERFFLVDVNGVKTRQPCAAGLAFVQTTCGCHKRIGLPTQRPVTGCEPDVYLPMDEDFADHSGWDRGVGNSGAVIAQVSGAVGGGAGEFDGSDAVWIYRYNNIEFPPYVEIRFRFKESDQSPSGSQPEALVTNGNCGDEPSLAISSERRSNDVSYYTETQKGEATTQTSYRDGWTDVRYVYDRREMSGTSATSTQSVDLSGIIRRTHSPLIIGHGQGYQNFTGYIDEFYVYFCEP
ncbi:uncharacterized protein LOC135476692 [Liolophura sinensis]|uniref:uncharacterized protein LOC135476692 n=1 Tax=Liolophura sinensis TaxID=3198878 RepID=UPI003158BA9D